MLGAQLTYLHLPENRSEGFSGRPHQVSVEGSADRDRFHLHVEMPRVVLEEIQCLDNEQMNYK